MPLDLQSKLLLVCEDRQVRRVGANRETQVDVQVIAAAHQRLAALVSEKTFRRDLFHRLNVLALELPPLRERGPDKLRLAERFVALTCAHYGIGARSLSPEARALISSYAWPGNVRELKNKIERLILLGDEGPILPSDFEILEDQALVLERSQARGVQVRLPNGGISLEHIEHAVIKEALRKCDGNVSQTARFLDVTRQKLMYRMKKHGLRPETKGAL
jgi:DNA-binding NtrC family response regulator